MNTKAKNKNLSLVRAGFEDALVAELAHKLGATEFMTQGQGWVSWQGEADHPAFVFERQRLKGSEHVARSELKPLSARVVEDLVGALKLRGGPWAMQAYGLDSDQPLDRKIEGLVAALLRGIKKQDVMTFKLFRKKVKPGLPVLQLALAEEGLFWSLETGGELLDSALGGRRRMKFDEQSPSRSYLKLEEVFVRMGREPQAGEQAVDLGAAPGGWSYSFLKRGCFVTSVDNGPMKITGGYPGRLDHLCADGLRFEPEGCADWMVSDMLIPPGQALGLLRRWLKRGVVKNFVVTIKIPQEEVWVPLVAIEEYLQGLNGVAWEMRQLYHNRREVTVWGTVS